MRVQLFGIIAEKMGAAEVEIAASTTHGLKRAVEKLIPGLDKMSYSLAVDRRVVHNDIALNGSEELALLPPFAGG